MPLPHSRIVCNHIVLRWPRSGSVCNTWTLHVDRRAEPLQCATHSSVAAASSKSNQPSCCRYYGTPVRATSQLCRCLSTESSIDPTNTPINKEHGGTIMTEQLYHYLLQHTREPEVLRWLRHETAIHFPVGARMQVTPEQAQFMAWLVQTTGACKALELGVFTGYSALAVALALPEQGKLVACDRDPRALQLAQNAFNKAGIAHKVEIRQGLAKDILHGLLEQSEEAASYDFAFIDADKRAYAEYFELCLKLLRPGGIIALDNVLWYGKVANAEEQDKKTVALRKLNADLLNDKRIRLSIVPVGDGMALCTKL